MSRHICIAHMREIRILVLGVAEYLVRYTVNIQNTQAKVLL
jgi:hypothetical protein